MSNKRENDVENDREKKRVKDDKRKERELPFEQLYLDNLPNTQMYERSYMHKDVCSNVIVTKTDFIITCDTLGYIKFWKKLPNGIEFVKTFRSHQSNIASISASHDGLWLSSVGLDKNVRIFDINNFDVINSFKLTYIPLSCQWLFSKESSKSLLAISSRESSDIYIYDPSDIENSSKPIHTLQLHKKPVYLMTFNVVYQAMVSIDIGGGVEYWSGTSPFETTVAGVEFEYKLDTDLYDMQKVKAVPQSISISNNGKYFALMASDQKVRIFNFANGKLHRVYDESTAVNSQLQKSEDSTYHVDPTDYGRRMAVEKDIDNTFDQFTKDITKSSPPPPTNIIFDESNNFIIYPTPIGIKIVNMVTNKVCRIIGKIENSTRFLGLALYQGKNEGDSNLGTRKKDAENDPTLFCLAYKKQRFYMFSRREPEDTDNPEMGRDVFNEKVVKDEMAIIQHARRQLPRNAIIHTTLGDIHCQLFPDECPKTVENFTTHSKNGYYDNVIFHRVIKNFMVQTGDPLGDGTGGTSIWNKDFEDEFNRNLRHDRPFTLSMANAGSGTNGSQFFITTVPVTRLDNKHTVFGRVYKGMEVVMDIEKVRTNKNDKPLEDISIQSIKITNDVPEQFKKK